MKKNNKKGFTLVELVIVVAVMAILVAVAIPTVKSITGTAQNAVDNSNAQALESVIKLWEAEKEVNGASVGTLQEAVNEAKLGIKAASGATKSFVYDATSGDVVYEGTADETGDYTITFDENGQATVSAHS